MKKHILWIWTFFIMCVLVCFMGTEVSAGTVVASGTCGKNVTWMLDDTGTLIISGTGAMDNYTRDVSNENTPVTPWADHKDEIKYLIVAEGVTHVGDYAFYDYSNLSGLSVADSVEYIGTLAFSGTSWASGACHNNAAVYLGKVLYHYGWKDSQNHVTVKEGTLCIASHAFWGHRVMSGVTLPEGLKYIGDSAFEGCYNMKQVYIPESVIQIGSGAFEGCYGLQSINLPEGLTELSDHIFWNCSDLEQIHIPDAVTHIGSYAFAGSGLKTVNLPNALVSIDSYAFQCGLTCQLTFPDTLQYIGGYAFNGCQFTEAVLPEGLAHIGNHAFYECPLEALQIPSTALNIGSYAFYGNKLEELTVPEGVITVGIYAFANSTLKRIVLPNSLDFIGAQVFSGCAYLEEITVPFLGESREADLSGPYHPLDHFFSHYSGTGLMKINRPNYSYYTYIPESLTKITLTGGTLPDYAFANCKNITHVVFGPQVSAPVLNYTFYQCYALTSFNFPADTTKIDSNAFSNCDALTTLTIPGNITEIGFSAFSYCSYLKQVNISEGVEIINTWAFYWCSSLISVNLPMSIKSISSYAFENAGLQSAYYPGSYEQFLAVYSGPETSGLAYVIHYGTGATGTSGSTTWTVSPQEKTLIISGTGPMKDYTTRNEPPWRPYRNSIEKVIIEEGVTTVGDYAFYAYFDRLSQVSLPSTLYRIGSCAFVNCSALSTIHIPAGVRQHGLYPFNRSATSGITVDPENTTYFSDEVGALYGPYGTGTYALIHLPASFAGTYTAHPNTAAIELHACAGNKNLKEIILPEGLTSINSYAFQNSGLEKLTLPSSLSHTGYYAFSSCPLQELTLSEGILHISDYSFQGCSQLTEVTIPDSIQTIGSRAFYNCSSLKTITLGNNVQHIKDSAFYNTKLQYIQLPASVTSITNTLQWIDHIAYAGTAQQWSAVSSSAQLDYKVFHTDTTFTHRTDCMNSGLFCPACNTFVTRERTEDGAHTYDGHSCTLCDYTRTVSSITISKLPDVLEFAMINGQLDLTGGLLQATYSDGSVCTVAMEQAQVSGFDNLKPGEQMLTVTFEGRSTSYTINIIPGTPEKVFLLALPEKLYYTVGQAPDLSGMRFIAEYPNNIQIEIEHEDLVVQMDLSQAGRVRAMVGYCDVMTEFEVFVHHALNETVDPSLYPESEHNYSSGTNETKTFSWPGAQSLVLTFSAESCTETNYDWVYIYDGEGAQLEKLSGSLAGKTVTVPGDSFSIKLTSDGSVTYWGYAFSSIVSVSVLHPYENGKCPVCEIKEPHLVLFRDTILDKTLTGDLYVDLNGYELTGTIVTNGYKIYGMDSSTDNYTHSNIGHFNCLDENGNKIVPEKHFNSDITGSSKRYMSIEDENGYSFHRFYLGITHQSLKPAATGVGYKAVFYGDDMVVAALDSYGFTMQLGNYSAKTVSISGGFVSGKTVSLRIDNYDVINHGETELYASVILRLADGTVIESTVCTMTLQGMLESVNNNHQRYTQTQLALIAEFITKYPIIRSWKVENLCTA